MNQNGPSAASVEVTPRRWPLFLLGVVLFFVGPAIYFVQVYSRQLWTPWYVPILASFGLLLMIISTAFTHEDLEKGSPTLLVFFRGRW
jgi:peptidoglycan/LPS O-acetylase OafA/YrhL